LTNKDKYEHPKVGTVFDLRSRYTEDAGLGFVKRLGFELEKKGLISEDMRPTGYIEKLRAKIGELIDKTPMRKHEGHWVDGGIQVAVFDPDTFFPFFFNASGSRICRLCDGKHTIKEIISKSGADLAMLAKSALAKDIVRFLLLLEELGLIELLD
jgi:hypothetical protein